MYKKENLEKYIPPVCALFTVESSCVLCLSDLELEVNTEDLEDLDTFEWD